jgi:hypothetical protein
MIRILAAALVALPLLAGAAFAQSCASPPPEPKTSAAPAETVTQPG